MCWEDKSSHIKNTVINLWSILIGYGINNIFTDDKNNNLNIFFFYPEIQKDASFFRPALITFIISKNESQSLLLIGKSDENRA